MQLLDVDGLIREGEADGILAVELDVLYIEHKRCEMAVECPSRRLAERAVKVERTGNSGMACKTAAEVGAPENIKIQLVHAKRELGRIVVAQLNVAAHK